jgi:hypothetical protein
MKSERNGVFLGLPVSALQLVALDRDYRGEQLRYPRGEQADLVADVLRRSLEIEGEPSAGAVAALAARVTELFTAIVAVQRDQLERAYG